MERELQKNSRILQQELMAIQGEGDPETVSIEMLESIEQLFGEADQYFMDKQKGIEAQYAWQSPNYKDIKPRVNTNLSPVKTPRKIKYGMPQSRSDSG